MTLSDTGEQTPSAEHISRWGRARRSQLGVACVVGYTLFTDMLTYGAILPVLPTLIIQRLKGDSSMVGFLFGCYAFGLLVATPIFAILSDKYQNRRLPMMLGSLGLVVSTLSFAAADDYMLLVIARVAQGVAGGASWTIGLGMLADVFPTNRLGVVMGTVLTAHTVGFAIGPAMGGFLFEYAGYSAPFICCAFFAAINFVLIIWVAEPDHAKNRAAKKAATKRYRTVEEGNNNDNDDTKSSKSSSSSSSSSSNASTIASIHSADEGVSEQSPLLLKKTVTREQHEPITMLSLCKNWKVMCCLLCTAVSASVFSGVEPALPIYLEKTYDASASTVGVIFVSMVIPAFLAPVIGFLSDKMGRDVISASGMVLMAIACPLVALHYSTVYMIVPALMVFGFSSPLTLTPILPEMGEIVDSLGGEAYAQVYALYNMAYSSGMFLGPNCAGLIMTYAGFGTLMWTFGAALLICSPVMMDWKVLWHKLTGWTRHSQ